MKGMKAMFENLTAAHTTRLFAWILAGPPYWKADAARICLGSGVALGVGSQTVS